MWNNDRSKQLGHILSESVIDEEKRRVGRRRGGRALASIQREILREIASHSGRYGSKLTDLLTTLKELGERIAAQKQNLDWNSETDREAINQVIERFNELQQEASKVRHHLIIHREAMGLWAHDDVLRLYSIPPTLPLLVHKRASETPGGAEETLSSS